VLAGCDEADGDAGREWRLRDVPGEETRASPRHPALRRARDPVCRPAQHQPHRAEEVSDAKLSLVDL